MKVWGQTGTQAPAGTAGVISASITGSTGGTISCSWTTGTWQRTGSAQVLNLPATANNCTINGSSATVRVVNTGVLVDSAMPADQACTEEQGVPVPRRAQGGLHNVWFVRITSSAG